MTLGAGVAGLGVALGAGVVGLGVALGSGVAGLGVALGSGVAGLGVALGSGVEGLGGGVTTLLGYTMISACSTEEGNDEGEDDDEASQQCHGDGQTWHTRAKRRRHVIDFRVLQYT